MGRIWSHPESARVRGLPRARYFSQWLLCVPSFNSLCLNTLGDGELTAGRSSFEALMTRKRFRQEKCTTYSSPIPALPS